MSNVALECARVHEPVQHSSYRGQTTVDFPVYYFTRVYGVLNCDM